MSVRGLVGRFKRRFKRTTIADPAAVDLAPDRVQRAFAPGGLAVNRVWVGDISYLRTWEGWSYLATVIDLASRRVVGFALADHMRTSLVLEALRMALKARRPEPGLIFHSDRGSQAEFKESLQHLVMEVLQHGWFQTSAGDSCDAWPDVVAGSAVEGAA
jgi:putative transposase